MAVNLHAAQKKTDLHAAHEALFMCFLLACSTWIMYYSHAAHEKACVQYTKMTCLQLISCHMRILTRVPTKLKNTHMLTACKCQLRCELYCTCYVPWMQEQNFTTIWFNDVLQQKTVTIVNSIVQSNEVMKLCIMCLSVSTCMSVCMCVYMCVHFVCVCVCVCVRVCVCEYSLV